MSRQNVNPCSWRFGLIAVLAIVLTLGFSGTPSALADPSSPLSVTKTASPSPVASGAEITYTITVVNTGGAKVSNVVMTDQLNGVGGIGVPPQLVLTSTRGSCSQSGLKVTCSAGSIEGLGSWIVTIRGVVTAANGTTLNNTASVTGTKSAQNFTTTASVQTLVQNNNPSPLADLTISKSGPSSVVQLSPMTYILTVNNIGNANATDIRVVDTLPAGVMADYVDSTSLFVCASGGSPVTITCDGGAVNQGSNATITIHAIAPSTTGNIANTAVVDPNNTIVESNELNNTSATVSTSVTSAPASQGLTITKTDDPDPVVPGAILKYTIVVQNIATTRADDVVVVDGTQGLEAASITASQVIVNGSVGNTGGCKVVAPQVTCSIKSLNSGGTQTITIQGQVIGSAGSSIINTATVTGNIKNQGVTAQATAHTTVKPAVDLTITKADSPDPVCARSWPQPADRLTNPPDGLTAADGTVPTLLATPGCLGGLTYTFVVGNSGIQDATAVVVRDPLPGGLILDSYSTDGGFTCAVDAANVVTCSGGAIPAESTRTISFLLVAPPDTGSISNTVTVDPNNAIYESDETNNTFVQATAVTTGIDLVIRKDDSPVDPPGAQNVTEGFDPIATSGTETYVITVDNVGPQDVTGIRVRDTLPAATRFLSVVADADHGFTCAHDGSPTGGIVECVGGHLLGTESEFYDPAGPALAGPGDDIATIKIKVFAQPTVGTMHNEVRVDPLNEIVEYNELNNFETEDTTVTNGGATLSAFNELSVVKTQTSPVPPDAVATNGTLKYKLDITNDATDPAVNIHVRDFLPTGARFIEAVDAVPGPDAFNCTYAAGVIDCVGGTLDGTLDLLGAGIGQTRTINITVFAPNTPGDYSNQSIVDPDNAIPEGNEFNNDSTIVTKVRTVGDGGKNAFNELTIKKTQTAPPSNIVATSSLVVYEIVVENTGTDPAFNVAVKDTLPAGFTYVEATDTAPGSQAFVCTTAPGNVVNCTGATLSGTVNTASGQPTSRTIQVKAFSSAVPGNYTNTAIVDPDNAIPEGDETNNMAQAPTKVLVGAGYVDLKVKKCDDPACTLGVPAQVDVLGDIIYYIEARNDGTDPAFNVALKDVLPAGVTFVSATDVTGGDGSFICGYASGVVTCSGGTLDGTADLIPLVPDVRNLQIKVKAPNANGPVLNQIFIDPDNNIPESNETNNSGTETTNVLSFVNLTLDKQGPDQAQQNNTEDYNITVENKAVGPSGAGRAVDNVHVLDTLPTGLIPLGWTAEGNFTCQIFENPVNTVDCVGDMNPGDKFKITIHVFITQDGGTLGNQACIDPDNQFVESDESDNCKTKTTVIKKFSPNLSVQKSASSSSVTPGGILEYFVTVSNIGDAGAASPVVITDNLPAGLTLAGTPSATNGFTCSGTSTITCQDSGSGLPVGGSTTITIQTTVNTDATGPIANTASVSAATFDANTAPCLADPSKCEDETTANQGNNSSTVSTSVGNSSIDLAISSITDTPDPVNPGQALQYTIVVANYGTAPTTSVAPTVQVKIEWPQTGVSLVGAAGSNGFNCNTTGNPNPVICEGVLQGAGFAPDNAAIITVNVAVNSSGAPPKLTLTAVVDPAGTFTEPDKNNNTKEAVTTVSNSVCSPNCIDLAVARVIGTPDPVKQGNTETFTVQVVNVGDTSTVNASGDHVTVDIDLSGNSVPAGVSVPTIVLTNAPPDVFSGCTRTTNVATHVVFECKGNLSAGAGATFTFSFTTVNTGSTNTITTSATASLSGALYNDNVPSNNTASYDVTANP